MLSLNVVPREDRPLTDQIVIGVKRQIDDRQLRPRRELQRRDHPRCEGIDDKSLFGRWLKSRGRLGTRCVLQ
jgi:hypothetical protein